MKSILFISFLFFTTASYSQNPKTVKSGTVSLFKDAFSKVPPGQFSNLVPFVSNGKWGYIDRITRKIIVKPIMQNPAFFHPNTGFFYNDELVTISENGNVSVEQPYKNASFSKEKGPNIDDKVKSSINGFKGFTVSITGELINYSDLYQTNKQGIPGWNIQLFQYNNKYYGIV